MPAKAIKIIGFLQFRIFLPLTLLGASLLRFNGLSFLYLACLLITPLLPIPSRVTMRGATGIFLKCLVPISILPVIGHIIFHVTLVAIATPQEPYGFYFANCSTRESLLRQIGFQRLDNASIPNIIRLIVPDAVVFIMALVILLLSLRITRQNSLPSQSIDMPLIPVIKQKTTNIYMKTLSQFTLNVALLAAGVIVPSIFGGVYFITFLILLTLWGCYIPMGRKFGFVQKLLLIYTGGHLLLLHLYQFQFFQDVLPPDDLIARVLGLTGIIRTECSDVDSVYFHSDVRWSVFINPFLLLVLFWITATNSRHSNFKTKTLGDERLGSLVRTSVGTERQRLVENEELPGGRYGGISSDEGIHESVPTTTNGEEEKAKRRPWMSVMLLIMKQSYVLSLIVMMAWSITYHSWLTFVFLLTACFLWMLPNSRTWCLRSSPFVLLYAELLLLAQYIFGMNLKELPTETNEYKFDEIGLKRHSEPSLNIGLQTIYTVFMVMTLRQYISERSPTARLDQQAYVLEQRPHRVSVCIYLLSSHVNIFLPLDHQERAQDSKTMIFIGHFLWVLLCKYWIIFCAIMMAVISLQDVVIYRIIYMFLFLFFVLIFQLNFTIWRRLNYIFWWIVIIYSIFILIIIYTYQFEQFHTYWTNFTGFDDTLLKDIGLERYDTTGLFVKLLTPTSFLVFVILQLRYFHTPFLKLSASDRYK
ncbi:unnamed protein product [Lymnaea stagnalis]|uniref:Piezo TM1-24 domain-containing protein n=1 Tax=Lymnaea stagnalis TaxID=6523 RepID=A0AAV2HH44_LYMST